MSGIWWLPTIVVLSLLILGPLGAWTGILPPTVGFALFGAAGVIGAVSAIALAGAAAYASTTDRAWRPQALRAAIVPFLVVIPLFYAANSSDAPPMNDISTDLEDRPALRADVAAGPADPPGKLDVFATMQREYYADVQPRIVSSSPEVAFSRALETARAMPGWEVTATQPERGRIEAVATSGLFRFRDDVVIRVKPEGNGARIDVRSRSRVGVSDLGANAERIRRFQAALEAAR